MLTKKENQFKKPAKKIWLADRVFGTIEKKGRCAVKTVLLVCTGNTCRSPMAQVMLQKMLADQGIGENQVKVISAGLYASNGEKASPQAVEVMEQRGLSLASHQSRRLTPKMINEAALILGMTDEHKQAVMMLDAAASDKVFALGEYASVPGEKTWRQVPDPFGRSVEVYEQTAQAMEAMLAQAVKKLTEERKVEGQ